MTSLLQILHVEDDPDIRLIAGLALQLDRSIAVRSVGSGDEAMGLLEEGWRPHLLLLDVMMPDLDGTGLVDRIRTLPGMEAVPLIFMTARTSASDRARYARAGAAAVIVKPFDPMTLAAQVRSLADRPVGQAISD